jgi:hypothetical protein
MRSNVGLTRWFLELLVVTIRPTFEERPKAVMARSISGEAIDHPIHGLADIDRAVTNL